jgi:acetyl-CoA synthetase
VSKRRSPACPTRYAAKSSRRPSCCARATSPPRRSKKDLQEHVKRTTAPYKYPRIIEFVSELPKTISGKIRRVELRERDANK